MFESHAGALGPTLFDKFSLPYLRRIANMVKSNLQMWGHNTVPLVSCQLNATLGFVDDCLRFERLNYCVLCITYLLTYKSVESFSLPFTCCGICLLYFQIVFAKDAHFALQDLGNAGYDVVSVDWTIKPQVAR